MILNIFSSRPDHPLGDPKELKRVLAELPLDNSFKAVDEVYGWYESLIGAEDFRVDQLFDVVRQLDEAAQPFVRRLTRDYLHTPRLSKGEERRMWSVCYNYWGEVSILYAVCAERARQQPKERGSEQLKASLPLLAARLVAARATQMKWVEYRYGPIGEDLWRGLGQAYLAADQGGYASRAVPLYPSQSGMTSVAQQYLQALVFHASSTDSLLPLEIELADRLVAHFLSGFVFANECRADSVYWVDAAQGLPPMRMARQPAAYANTMRFLAPGAATQALRDLQRSVERGEVPASLNLGGEYSAKLLLPVLRHLSLYWAAEPPQREFQRHAVKTRIAVLQGFDDCFTVLAGDVARLGKERSAESWVVENASLGGFGACIDESDGECVRIGSLLCMQPEGGENWVLGLVRRYHKQSDTRAGVGIKALSKRACSVELWPRTSGFSATGALPGIWLRENESEDEVRVVLPLAAFDLRENLEFTCDEQRYLLTPFELEESGNGFEIGRYRKQALD